MSICTLPPGVYGWFKVELKWFKTSSEGKLGLNQSLCLIVTGEKSSLVGITGNKKNSVLEVRPILLYFCRGNYNQFKVLIIWTVAHFSLTSAFFFSFITATFMVEAMAAANAFLRLKTEDKSLSVSIIYVQ